MKRQGAMETVEAERATWAMVEVRAKVPYVSASGS